MVVARHEHVHAMRAGGGFAARRLIISLAILALIGIVLAWWVTDGFRGQNWRDVVEWRLYEYEQKAEMG